MQLSRNIDPKALHLVCLCLFNADSCLSKHSNVGCFKVLNGNSKGFFGSYCLRRAMRSGADDKQRGRFP